MINKKNIWLLTLFSLVLVLSIYYVTIPSEILVDSKLETVNNEVEEKDENEQEESSILVSLRVNEEEEYLDEVKSLTNIIANAKSTIDEKNNAYEQMKNLNNTKNEQENLSTLIKNEYNLDSFIKIDGTNIKVIVDSKKHDVKLANNIMRLIQSKYNNKMFITVKFQS